MDLQSFNQRNEGNENDPWNNLLDVGHKVFKDPVYGDEEILATSSEIKIIDLPIFQRLRYITQLGPSYLLYPSANHKRFEHSLGTLHQAEKILQAINRNSPIKIDPRNHFLIRLLALTHDVAHVPFSHMLEDDGGLFKYKQWKNPVRQEIFWPSIRDTVLSEISQSFRKYGLDGTKNAEELVSDLKSALIDERIENGSKSYVPDIVSNTICADLFDYEIRDSFYTGFPRGPESRLYSYFILDDVEVNGKLERKFVIRLYKPSRPYRIRDDALSSIIELLNIRSNLGERIYYHHTRRETSAMVIKMVASAIRSGIVSEQLLCELGDDELTYYILHATVETIDGGKNEALKTARKLAASLKQRRLYKPVFELGFFEREAREKIDELRDWQHRNNFEQCLADLAGLSESDVIVYLPKSKMNHKTAMALVKASPESNPISLDEFSKGDFDMSQDYASVAIRLRSSLEALKQESRNQWRLSVLLSQDVLQSGSSTVRNLCESWFKTSSPIEVVRHVASKMNVQLKTENAIEIVEGTHTYPMSTNPNECTLSRFVKQASDAMEQIK